MVKVLVLGDERKGGSKERVDEFAEWLRTQVDDVEVVLDRDSSLEGRHADLVVVFGGDGSLLAAARRMGENQMPTVGINLGRLGFLTSYDEDHAHEAVKRFLDGKLHEEKRLLLRCSVLEPDGSESESVLCVNDGVLLRAATAGMITLRVLRHGRELALYRGDGLIVATAAGSTAYSMAAGGPVLTPDMDSLVLTPLASHTLTARPLVLPVEEGIEVEVLETGGRKHTHFQMDGQVLVQMVEGARARFRPATVRFRHLSPSRWHFFEVLRAQFGWADLPRQRR